ncbi:alpha/beta hydrolase [Labrys monachus]|uniref:Acetyl esterase n=1 Tax=Labrys monachus TaxID=217067 RepID=A0ABU0FDI8_9HYPH|nr:alpha/beta hydrolase [Labrys monachus]MDQ0392586.1 acetyl esterase [Labrys monachus]
MNKTGTALTVETLPGRLTPDLAALLAAVEAEAGPQPDTTLMPPAEGRHVVARINQRWNRDLPAMASTADVTVPADATLGSADCAVQVLVPPNAGAGALIFIHGGGFAFGNPQTHERCARVLAIEAGLPVLSPDYRLSPEHPFPAGLTDIVACLRAAFEAAAQAGVRPGPLIVSGDSAGANLALAAMLHEQQAGRPLPAGALLFYGAYDADFDTPSYRRFRDGPGLTTGKMRRYWDWYVADEAARRNPLASPLHASDAALRALPPLHLMAAEIDPILSDTLNLGARLASLGRPERVHLATGATHGFLQMTGMLADARQALAEAGAAARAMIA